MVGTATEKESGHVWIPKISRETLLKLSKQVRQVVSIEGFGLYYAVKPVDPHFSLRNPTPAEKVEGNLKPYCTIGTFHTFSDRDYFTPTLAEVLAQIPPSYTDKVVAFEITTDPTRKDDPLNTGTAALKSGYHTALTRFYTEKK